MLSSTIQAKIEKTSPRLISGLVVFETILVTLALVPAQVWIRLLPSVSEAPLNGPFPPAIAPIIACLLYVLPTVIGFLARDWQRSLLFSTFPAWIGLGLFLIAATGKIGAFSLLSTDQVTGHVSMLELFAVLGGIGWLLRSVLALR